MLKGLKIRRGSAEAAVAPPTDPYTRARMEFNEVWGSQAVQAKNWRAVAILSTVIALVCVVGLAIRANQSKFIPYVVQVDKHGAAVAVGMATGASSSSDDLLVRAFLNRFMEDVRRVTVDPIMQKESVARTFAMVANGSSAQQKVTEFFSSTNPFLRGTTETVSIDVSTPLRISDQSWQIAWRETTRELSGKVISAKDWKATLTVAFNPPSDMNAAVVNPLGLYVTDLDWRPEITR